MIYNCANWADLPWTEVRPGVCDYHIEDQVFRLTPGGMLVIPPNLMHYAEVVGDEVLVNFDIFTPKREEYVK